MTDTAVFHIIKGGILYELEREDDGSFGCGSCPSVCAEVRGASGVVAECSAADDGGDAVSVGGVDEAGGAGEVYRYAA